MTNWILKLSQSQNKITLLLQKYKITPEQLNLNIQSDPTPNKQYLDWILRQTTSNPPRLRLPEDQEKTLNALNLFHSKKQFLTKKDINQYQSLGELTQVLEEVTGQTSKREKVRINTQEGQQLVAQDGSYKCLKITREEAAASLCRNTEWCIKDPKYFREYGINESNPLFLFFKNDVPFALLNIKSQQFKDVYDRNLVDREKESLSGIFNKLIQSQEFYNYMNPRNSRSASKLCFMIGKRIKELEPFIMSSASDSYEYARDVIEGRWPEAEPVIMRDAEFAYLYADNVIKKRFMEAEQTISRDPLYGINYAKNILGRRWEEVEHIIINWPIKYIFDYVSEINGPRWLDAEQKIKKHPKYAHLYAKFVIQGRWPEAEPYIMQDGEWSFYYARDIMNSRWPEAEPAIKKDAYYWSIYYDRYIVKKR